MRERHPDRVGHYVLGELIGKGGMGEVYLARDSTLDRDVAIKILPAAFRDDADRLRRMTREAKVLASLSHPHIATIHGLVSDDAVQALVLEYVPGSTLAEEISKHGRTRSGSQDGSRGLSIRRAISIARQIAEALDAAHQHGVVHRDLKPANVKVTPEGHVKVLDFGLATQISNAGETTVGATGEGVAVGTAAYMSPEQARGHPIDKRTDIWAFGCVLFEMLTGTPAFGRETTSDSLASVLHLDPDWSALPAATPPTLRALLERCLAKDVDRRWRDIGDARFDLDAAEQPDPSVAAQAAGRKWLWPAVALAALLLAIAAWLVPRGATVTTGQSFQFDVDVLPTQAPWSGVAVSPSGGELAIGTFGPGASVTLYSLATGERRPVQGPASAPFWSPDGSMLGFVGPGQLRRVDVRGGPPVKICDARLIQGATWNANNVVLFSSEGRLLQVSAWGGTAVPLAFDDADANVRRTFPRFLPDDTHFLFQQDTAEGSAVFVGSLDSTTARRLIESASAVFAPPKHLLFMRGTALLAQEFDVRRLQLVGSPSVVAADVAPGFLSGQPSFSSSEGVLAYVLPREGTLGRLTWFDANGRAMHAIEPPSGTEYLNPALSPDGTRVAVNRMDPENARWNVWVLELARDVMSRVTFQDGMNSDAVWSPDGKEIVFASVRGERAGLYRKSADASTATETLFETDRSETLVPSDWSSDGRYIVYSHSRSAPGGWRVSLLPLFGDRKPISLFPADQFQYYGGRLSPDVKWLAYAGMTTGRFELYVRPFLATGTPIQVTRDGGVHPRWKSDGRELQFWRQPGGIYSAPVVSAGVELRVGMPRPVVDTRVAEVIDGRPHYDATRDGQRYLLRQAVSRQPPVRVLVNWRDRLERRQP
jgi:tRNA A-37 threonylcarbamoyl transferase component Bud32